MEFVQYCTYNGKVYYRTDYSKSTNVNNGVPAADLSLSSPEEEKIKWTTLPNAPYKMVALRDCKLVDVKTKDIIKEFELGEVIDNIVDYADVSDGTYYRTQYSKDQKKSYGIDEHQLAMYEDPKEEPEAPEDEPIGDVDRPEDAAPIDGDKAPNWFVNFIMAIVEAITSFFKKG